MGGNAGAAGLAGGLGRIGGVQRGQRRQHQGGEQNEHSFHGITRATLEVSLHLMPRGSQVLERCRRLLHGIALRDRELPANSIVIL